MKSEDLFRMYASHVLRYMTLKVAELPFITERQTVMWDLHLRQSIRSLIISGSTVLPVKWIRRSESADLPDGVSDWNKKETVYIRLCVIRHEACIY